MITKIIKSIIYGLSFIFLMNNIGTYIDVTTTQNMIISFVLTFLIVGLLFKVVKTISYILIGLIIINVGMFLFNGTYMDTNYILDIFNNTNK